MRHAAVSRATLLSPALAAALICLPVSGQHAQTTAQTGITRPVAPSARPGGTSPQRLPGRVQGGSSQHNHVTIRANNAGAYNAPPPRPTWEIPKNVTPHWEIPSYNNVQPNYVQGNEQTNAQYRRRNRAAYGFGGYGVGYIGVPYYTDTDAYLGPDNANDPQAASTNQAPRADYVPEQPEQGQADAAGDYDWGEAGPPPDMRGTGKAQRKVASAATPTVLTNGLDHPEVTLVFNDGRPAKKVRSYALTGSSVFVSDNGHQTQIPIADLDMAATVARNREAGVDFELPGASR